MALTIRTLNTFAEKGLKKIIKTIPSINSKSKAVEYALEQYPILLARIERISKNNENLQDNNEVLNQKLEDIKFAIKIFKDI